MAARRLTPTNGTPIPPIPTVPPPAIPGLTPVSPTTTIPTTPTTTPPSSGPRQTTSNKVKTRLGTVSMEQLPGDPASLAKTYGKSIKDMIINAPVGVATMFVGGGIDIAKAGIDVGAKLIGVDYEPGRYATSYEMGQSFKRTGQTIANLTRYGSAMSPGLATPRRIDRYVTSEVPEPLPEHYMAALEANQSILPFIIEDFGNISMAGTLYSGIAKGAIRGVTLGEAATMSERAAASQLFEGAAAGSAEAAEAAARMAAADAKLARIARTKKILQEQMGLGKAVEKAANKVGALPFKPYSYGTRKLLGLWREGIYLGPDGRYARWGEKASKGYAEQAQRLVDDGVSPDDPRVVDLMNKSVKAGRRSVARQVMKEVREAVRDADNEQGASVRAVTDQMQDPLHKDVINPETGEAYGEMSADEAAAVLAIIGGNAQIINRLALRYNIPPKVLALLGRYDFKPEFSLSERAAEMARDFINYTPDNPGTLTLERYERLAEAAEKVANSVFKSMTERAVVKYGRRNALSPEYVVPTPFAERLERNILESIRQADKALKKERSKKTPNPAEIARLEMILNDRYALYDSWQVIQEAGILDLPVDHPDRLATLKGFVDQLPIELALDPTMYPASMRVPVEFYRRLRRAMAAKIIGEEGGGEVVGPDGEPTGPRPGARSTKEGAVEAELAKRERSKAAIERKIKNTAEQIDKLEVQHAKLVERILRYDVVDAYINGASLIQIIGDFKLDGNLVRKILENSPVARTYRRIQNIKTRLAEIESEVGSANIDKIDAIMARAEELNQEAAAAQAEYDRIAALAEEERQQIEAEADALNNDLYDLEEEMGDYEGDYEDAGGVVDDLYDDDGTIVVEEGGTLRPTNKRDVSEKTGLTHPMDVMEEMFGPQLEKIRELRQKNEDQRNSRKKNKEYVDVPEPEIDLNLQPVNNEYTVKGTLILSGQDRMNTNDYFEIEVLGTPRTDNVGVRANIYANYASNKFDETLETIDYAIGELTKIIEGELDYQSFSTMAFGIRGDWGGSTVTVFDTTDPDFDIFDDIEGLLRRGEAVDLTSVKQIISALEELKQQIVNIGTPGRATKTPGLKAPATPKPPVKTDFELVNEVFDMYGFSRRTDVGKMILNTFDDSPVKVETAPDKIIEGQNKYIVKAINSPLFTGFHVFVAGNAPYFSDGFVVIPMETTTFKNVIIPIAPDGSGTYYYNPLKEKGAKANSSNVSKTSDSTSLQAIIEKYINPDGSPKEKGKPLQEVGRDISDGVVVVVLETADGERVHVPLERYQAIGKAQYYYTGERPVLFDSAGQFGVVMSSNPALFEGSTKVDRLVSSLEKMKLTPSQFNGRMVKTVIEDFRNALGGKPKEIAVTYQPGYEPKLKPAVDPRVAEAQALMDEISQMRNRLNELDDIYEQMDFDEYQRKYSDEVDALDARLEEAETKLDQEYSDLDIVKSLQTGKPVPGKPASLPVAADGRNAMADYVIIPCGKEKSTKAAKVEDFYLGSMFQDALNTARQLFTDDRIFVVSAKHGLVPLDTVLEPYDMKMGDPGSVTPDDISRQILNLGLANSATAMSLLPKEYHSVFVRGADRIQRRWTVTQEFAGTKGIGEQKAKLKNLRSNAPKLSPVEKPKATKPSEVKPDENISNPVVREAVYTKEVVDAMAADAAAKMDAAETFNEKIAAFQEFVELSKKYDAEVARMVIELDASKNARAKKKKIEEKIAELREALGELPEQLEAAEASIEGILSNPFYEAYKDMSGGLPLDVALEGGYPSEIGGFEVPGPEGEGVRLVGPMYYPSGVPKEFFGGIQTEVIREGFTGFEKLSSEHYRDGDRQVVFSFRELAIRMGRQVRQMVMNERFRALVSQFGKSASNILGEEYIQQLYDQAVKYVDSMPIDTMRVHVTGIISESLGEDMPVSGIASPGPGVKNPKFVREFAIKFEFGKLIGEAMRARGYEAIDPYADIEQIIPAQNITARRSGETVLEADVDGVLDGPPPDEVAPETLFLPKGIKEKMAQVVGTKNEGAFEKAMDGARKVTSFFKVGTLVFSIPWQVGDLTSSMIISTMAGVDPRVLIKYMKEIKVQEYGQGKGSFRRMVDPNADWSDFRRGPLARLAGESGVQNLGQTLQERAYLYGEDLQPKRGIVDRLSGGRLAFVSEAAAKTTGYSFKINETINKIVRHAFFLEQLDIQLRAKGQTLESIKNVENWQNDAQLRQAVFDAARSANQWLGDYANLTVQERKFMGPLIPFWSWIRHIHGVFDLVAVNNPEALFYYMYLGTLANEEDDPLGLRSGGFNVFGGVASSNWLNPFADVVGGPIGGALLEQDLRPLGGTLGPVPRLLGGALGLDVSRLNTLRRPTGTGGYSDTGELTSRSVLPLVGGSIGETLGFTAQQFPIAQRLMNLNPTPFENIPGTRIALGPVARYQTGEARLSPETGQRIVQPGGRLASALRLFGAPLVPYRTEQQINDVLMAARQKLLTLDEIQRLRELQGAP